MTPLFGASMGARSSIQHLNGSWRQHLGQASRLDYSVALKLHLYQYGPRMAEGCKLYKSSGLNYDPKFHWLSRLEPLDLYVLHTRPALSTVLRLVLPLLGPVRYELSLKQLANYHELWRGVSHCVAACGWDWTDSWASTCLRSRPLVKSTTVQPSEVDSLDSQCKFDRNVILSREGRLEEGLGGVRRRILRG